MFLSTWLVLIKSLLHCIIAVYNVQKYCFAELFNRQFNRGSWVSVQHTIYVIT